MIRELKLTLNTIRLLFVSPLQAVQIVPDLSWFTVIGVQLIFSTLSGLLAGLLLTSWLDTTFALIAMPVSGLITSVALTGFLYVSFSLFQNVRPNLRSLYTLVVLSFVPFYTFNIASGWIPPINLVGFAFSCLLIVVGSNENYEIDRGWLIRFLSGLYIIYAIAWGTQLYLSGH